ncbi:MAG: DNA mismatch repair protein MutS [Acholeplasmatales bacterium]|nr:MAG: DNA mismatch repair protein MutS [Acholeplasmatales bacterium]
MVRDKQAYTPMMQQYLTVKEAHPDAIVFFRLGDFYEMFFEDALLASRELEIQLTARDAGAKDRVPMCGVPYHAVEGYLKRLIDKGYKVAICEQTEQPGKDTKLVKRDVVRIVTPGTHIDDDGAAEFYLAAVGITEYFYSLATLNIATGDLTAMKIDRDQTALVNELAVLPIREIIVGHGLELPYLEAYAKHEGITLSVQRDTDLDQVFSHLHDALPTPYEEKAVKRLLAYVFRTQKRVLLHIKPARHVEATATLKMDINTLRSLELTRTLRQNHENGSLFWFINKTKTAMGARLLKRQLLKPLLNKDILTMRHDFVETVLDDFITADNLREALKGVYDLERIVGRVAYGNTHARDLVQLRKSLSGLPVIKEGLSALNNVHAKRLNQRIDPLETLHDTLEKALLDDAPMTLREGNMFKAGYDAALDELKEVHLNVTTFLEQFEAEERARTGIKKLKIGYNRVFGYYIEIPRGQVDQIQEAFGYTRKQTLANAERYVNDLLKEKEAIILSSEEKSIQLEYELFLTLRDQVRTFIARIQGNAETVAELDMLLAFAALADKGGYVRPHFHDEAIIDVRGSKHPVVASVLDQPFMPNDIVMDDKTSIHVLTGPNMSGKSTYMRQLAITAILAQMGSFVPADSAKLPIFDQLFTRIGASDDLIGGKSTFMVEMLDANHAIQHATKQSLILFDEIGRGTATYDGLAIAQAIIEYIHEKVGCKTLFSTHYHELTDLEAQLEAVRNIHVAAEEHDGQIVFLHQVRPGKADKSYGINVASLAELPKAVIRRASQILQRLEQQNHQPPHNLFSMAVMDPPEETQSQHHQALIEALASLDVDTLTPLEALNRLYSYHRQAKRRD